MTVQQKLQPTTNLPINDGTAVQLNLPINDGTAVQFDCKPLLLLDKQRKIMTKNWQI